MRTNISQWLKTLGRRIAAEPVAMAFLAMLYGGHVIADDAFREAVWGNDLTLIAALVEQVEDVDARGTNGKTALMIAARAGHSDLTGNLLHRGADANAANDNGGTPLMFAAVSGNLDIINQLLQAGADVQARGSNGWSALMVAVAKGHEEATRRLLQSGADVNAVDIYLWSALHRAAYTNRREVTAVLLAQEDIDTHLRDEHGATALHLAAINGHTGIVELLLAHGADPGHIDSFGRTAARYAMDGGFPALARLIEEAS